MCIYVCVHIICLYRMIGCRFFLTHILCTLSSHLSTLIPYHQTTLTSVSINCAHLHPQYGIQSPEEQLAELKHEEEEGEVDVNMQEYKKQRDEARRSPYPSVIVEVQSTPPPDFGTRRDEAAMMMEAAAADMMGAKMSDNSDGDVTSDDVKKLEALFGLSAAKKSTKPDDPFYDALGEVRGCVLYNIIVFSSKIISNLISNFPFTVKPLGIRKQASHLSNATPTGSELGTAE